MIKQDLRMTQLLDTNLTKRDPFAKWSMIILWAGMLIFAGHACTHMVAAGDTWVAMACGRHYVNHKVDTVEPFSANSHKPGPTNETMRKYAIQLYDSLSEQKGMKASVTKWWAQRVENYPNWPEGFKSFVKWFHPTGWVNQNWGTHAMFYWLAHTFGGPGEYDNYYDALIYWKFIINIIAVVCIYYTARLLGASKLPSAAAASWAMFVGRTFIDVRPAVFSNILVAVFILALALGTYRNIHYIWLIVPIVVFWANVHGGYIYLFMMLVPFIGIHFILNLPKTPLIILYNVTAWPFLIYVSTQVSKIDVSRHPNVSIGGIYGMVFILFIMLVIIDLIFIFFYDKIIRFNPKKIIITIAASIAAFIAMVLFNPYHLTNLTHTFIVSISKHAESWRNVHEWHPAFDWMNTVTTRPNPVGEQESFGVMFVITMAVVLCWIVTLLIKPKTAATKRLRRIKQPQPQPQADIFQWPNIDLTLMAIAAMTFYMALKSRRFIPVAAMTALPFVALFLEQSIKMIAARINFDKNQQLILPPAPKSLRPILLSCSTVIVLVFGVFWGLKYKQIYLDPWPNDDIRDSVFMRMTASNVKPFDVCQFIRENKLSGKVFNHWTEGGATAFGQNPDPQTGETPLELFMDGRSQAAYDHSIFRLYLDIKGGGNAFRNAALQGRAKKLNQKDLTAIGKEIDQQMKKHNVWVIAMPYTEYNTPFVRSLRTQPNWRTAYIDNYQQLFVNNNTPKGKALMDNLGNLKFPNEFSKSLTFAHNLSRSGNPEHLKQAYVFAKKTFQIDPSQASAIELITAARQAKLNKQLNQDFLQYLNDFSQSKSEYAEKGGYLKKLEAAFYAANELMKKSRNTPQGQKFQQMFKQYQNEFVSLKTKGRW